MKKVKKIIIWILSLSISIQSFTVQAFYGDEKKSLKPGIYQNFDNLDDLSSSQEEWIQSGAYFYEFIDSQKRYIIIRKIKSEAIQPDGTLKIPSEIAGCKVLWIRGDEKAAVETPSPIRKLILPEGLEVLGKYSFYGCRNLVKISLPESLARIHMFALEGCVKLKRLLFPQGIYVNRYAFGESITCYPKKMILYSNSIISFDSLSGILFPAGAQTELDIRYYKKTNYCYKIQGYINRLRVDKKLSKLQLEMGYHRVDDSAPSILDYDVKKLIINGKNTKLKLSENVGGELLQYINDSWNWNWNSAVKGLYTVKGAKAIKEARKYKIPYCWKTAGKTKKVKAKKKDGVYLANWKKGKTTVCKHFFSTGKDKWKIKKTSVKTVYKVYGKKKDGSYKFIKTTKKRSIKSGYKYIKAVPVKEWD